MTVLLEANEVHLRFGGVVALSGVTLSAAQGEVVGLIGPNGAGKTTFLNVLSGIYQPASGTIRYRGAVISGLKPHRIAKLGIARTFQVVQPFAHLTVRENVAVGTMFSGGFTPTTDETLTRADAALRRVGLFLKGDRLPKELTLSERKRLEFARAIAMDPQLLLLDEVMAGLNHKELEAIVDLILEIKSAGLTIIVVEHVMKAIMAVCDRVVVLQFGRKIADAPPRDIALNPSVISAYLGDRFSKRYQMSIQKSS